MAASEAVLAVLLKELVAVEKKAIYSGQSQASRLREIERLLDNSFKELDDHEAQAD